MKNLLSEALLNWYSLHKRPLPFREDKNPYKVWLAEVIMQQTRMEQGLPYYERFLERFPTVFALAVAGEEEVLKLWQGLGYYSRGRNLLLTAKEVVERHGGVFPSDEKELLKLKGIGVYTAAAILSICYNKSVAVVDGNVYRVLARMFLDEKPINTAAAIKHFKSIAETMMRNVDAGDFNQAMMELGSLVCLPQNPLCEACPFNKTCLALRQNRQKEFPVKGIKLKVKERWFHFYFMSEGGGLLLNKRPSGDIWQGLFDLPLVEMQDAEKPSGSMLKKLGFPTAWDQVSYQKHKLTHQVLHIRFYANDLQLISSKLKKKYAYVPFYELEKYALPRPIEIFLKNYLQF